MNQQDQPLKYKTTQVLGQEIEKNWERKNNEWYGEQWDFQNNKKTMEHSDHWIMTG